MNSEPIDIPSPRPRFRGPEAFMTTERPTFQQVFTQAPQTFTQAPATIPFRQQTNFAPNRFPTQPQPALTGVNRALSINRRIFRPRPAQTGFTQQQQSFQNQDQTFNNFATQSQNQFVTPLPQTTRNSFFTGCIDRDPEGRCPAWRSYCRDPHFSSYMQGYCQRTCGFC
ncbi:hypothetical protein WR25_07879 [Diploscapter pachys]|uniref:ShKT domain-containing protein n=1 Tax=Diploscapter pachys TaxID=2018661 RepID=A0A2A2LH65_9BILA|nr:hypothetical protein WR25_07879 [Diploscapter pachys]